MLPLLEGQNAYPLSHGWTWMARIVNMPPWPITPSLINVFLEVRILSWVEVLQKVFFEHEH